MRWVEGEEGWSEAGGGGRSEGSATRQYDT